MNLEEFDIIIFITGIIFGCLATSVFKNAAAKKARNDNTSTEETLTLKSLQAELNNRQTIIDSLFINSNEQLVIIEKRLSNLRNALSESSQQLSSVNIESSDKDEAESSIDTVTPPRDYAPKTAKEPGMLSESFGLDGKTPEVEEPKRSL